MHDTFLNERLYEAILKICEENCINRLKKLVVAVNIDSHISESSLREHFDLRNSRILGEWTNIKIEKQEVGHLTAVIKGIEGETKDE